jgi:NADH:ubiquinone oxidoreductase subunit 6 (subunit J)
MTKQEFIKRRDSLRNRSAVLGLFAFAVMMGSLVLAVHIGEGHKDWPLAVRVPALGILLLLFFGSVPALLVYTHRLERRAGLICPHCAKVISRISTIVIATNNCGYCGETVFDPAA